MLGEISKPCRAPSPGYFLAPLCHITPFFSAPPFLSHQTFLWPRCSPGDRGRTILTNIIFGRLLVLEDFVVSREEIFAGINFCKFLPDISRKLIVVNYLALRFKTDFAGINFRELGLIKDFTGINFWEINLYKDFAENEFSVCLQENFFHDLSLCFWEWSQ